MPNLTAADVLKTDFSDGTKDKYLTFWTNEQLFAIPIADVVQIVQMQALTAVPDFPSYVKGVINLRGSIIPAINVRLRFGMMEEAYTEHTCIIVTSIRDKLMGFIVDSVEEVTDILPAEVSPPPEVSGGPTDGYLTGIAIHQEHVILLLDSRKILSDEQFDEISSSYGR